jgi:hypothetical protein
MIVFCSAALGLSAASFAQSASAPASAAVASAASSESEVGEHSSAIEVVKSEAKVEPSETSEPVADPATLLPDLPPVPQAKATLIGGTIGKLDRVRDQMTMNLFGGGHMKVAYDPRTRIYLKGAEGSTGDLHEGERVYLDTILDGTTVFARSIRLKSIQTLGESQGVVLKYRADRGELTVRDAISPTPLHVRLDNSTQMMQGEQKVSAGALVPGALITIRFSPTGNGHEVAREISVLALPGTNFTFAGQVENLDLHTGLLVLNSSTDHKTYEIYLDSSVVADENLRSGAVVTVVANFDGSRYVAHSLIVDAQSQ